MNAVTALDVIEFLSALTALIILTVNWQKSLSAETKAVIVFLLLFKLYHGFSNVMQWGGYSMAFDESEDYFEIMVPLLWAGFIALFLLWQQNEDLLKLDRVKDALVRDVSHELKTPVAKHSMQMEIIRPIMKNHSLSEAELEALAVMEKSIRRQELVIRNLLDLARLQEGRRQFRRERVKLSEVCTQVIADYRYEMEKYGTELTCSVPPIEVISDGEMLWHLLSNLVNNSVKFRLVDVVSKVDISAEEAGERVILRVADNGRGMTAEELDKAFDRFFQGSASAEGSGVGLSICQAIAEGLGCELALESPGRGQGVTATISFPRKA